ncbi:MAG TPA: OsmC family protein [Bacteroidia bacterium]|jgi:putative redox protein|nr:OsmC family protein [Bacteroidia bacterium]
MQIKIKRFDSDYGFEAVNDTGKIIRMDAGHATGGHGQAFSPMQTVLAAIGGCSGIDMISILKKQKQQIESFEMIVDGEREKDAVPAPFTAIHITYHLKGKIDQEKAQRAADLSIEKYCSVSKMLEKSAKITYEVKIN